MSADCPYHQDNGNPRSRIIPKSHCPKIKNDKINFNIETVIMGRVTEDDIQGTMSR